MPPKKPTHVEPLKDLPDELNTKIKKGSSKIVPLKTNYELLVWTNCGISYPNMIRVMTIGDGSCFFHALLNSFYMPYRTQTLDGLPITQVELITNLRTSLATRLGERINAMDTHYSQLGDGALQKLSDTFPRYSLDEMQKTLADATKPIGNEYNEFISNQLNKDIYILDGTTHDVYMTGDNWEKLYKNRDSIVLLYIPGHYELISILENNIPVSLFKPDNPFITTIRNRMIELCQQ